MNSPGDVGGCCKLATPVIPSEQTSEVTDLKKETGIFCIYFWKNVHHADVTFTVRWESHCTLRLWYVDLVVSIEVAVEVCCCFTVLSC
jgi:hypothetical protein